MARPLFASYSGPLFKLQRASDNATQDIGFVNGLADVAAANSFCSGTTCRYIVTYDQTPYHLDAVNTVRSDSTLQLHPPLYTTTQMQGKTIPFWVDGFLLVGSRANSAWGNGAVPVGSVPVSVYSIAIRDTTHPGDCCYDFGEAEATIADTGNGHMFAFNLEILNGVDMDLENGGIGASGSGHLTPSSMLAKTDGVSLFTMKYADPSGSLVVPSNTAPYCSGTFTFYNAPLSCWGYGPLHLEGGVTIGCGGDGSGCQPLAAGAFIEGAIIAAETSDATDDAIQASINALFGP
jgi:hypothetical protein